MADPIIPDIDENGQTIDALNTSQAAAVKHNPDEAASTLSYARMAGIGFDAAAHSKPAVPQQANWGQLVKDHPVLAQTLTDPGTAAVAQDDVHNLSIVERLFGGWRDMAWAADLAMQADSRNQEISAIGRAQRNGAATPEQLKRADELEAQGSQAQVPKTGFFSGVVPSMAGMLPAFGRVAPAVAAGATAGLVAGAAGGAEFGAAAGAAGGPAALATGAAGAAIGGAGGVVAGAGLGLTGGFAIDTARTEQGLAYRQYVKAGADPQAAGVAADIVALANGGLQTVPVGKVLNVLPGMKTVLAGAATKDIMAKMLASKSGAAVLARFAGRVAESGLTMALISGGQELIKEVGAIAAGAPDAQLSAPQIGEAALSGAQQGIGFGVAHAAAPLVGDVREMLADSQKAADRVQFYKSLAQVSSDSKLRERMPEEFKRYANHLVSKYGKIEEAKAPAEAVTSLLQKEGITSDQIERSMPEVARQLKTAHPSDEIVIPMEDVATHLAPLKSFGELQQDLRIGDELTPREGKEVQAEVARRMSEKPEEIPEGSERKVYDNVYDQLIKSGQDSNVAQHNATLWAAFAKTRGERTGMDPYEYFAKRSIGISNEDFGGPEAMSLFQPTSSVTISDTGRSAFEFSEKQNKILKQETKVLEYPETPIKLHVRVGEDSIQAEHLQVGDEKENVPKYRGQGYSSALYLKALDLAQNKGLGFKSDSIRSEATERMYARLKDLGVPFKFNEEANGGFGEYNISGDDLSQIDLKKVEAALEEKAKGRTLLQSNPKSFWGDVLDRAQQKMEAVKYENPNSYQEFPEYRNAELDVSRAQEALKSDTMFQGTRADYRGKITFDDPRSFMNITLNGGKANLSTFIHESGHAFFEFLQADAKDGHEQSIKDLNKIREWVGAKEGEELSVDHLETFARGFEARLREGKAPAAGLEGAYRAFSSWLKYVYRSIKGLNVDLTDDMRGVMDRLVASDKEIEKAATSSGLDPAMPDDPKYMAKFQEAIEASKAKLERDAIREFQRTVGEERSKVKEDVESKTKADQEYNTLEVLKTGKRLDGGTVPEEIAGKKLSREALEESGYKGRKWNAISEAGGLDPEEAAPYFGYDSADEMLTKLEAKRSRGKEVADETDRRMSEKYPDADIAMMSEKAVKAVHETPAVENLLWHDALTAAKKLGREDVKTQREALRQVAKRRVEDMTALEMQPGRAERAERAAANDWADAVKKGDDQGAFEAKMRQLYNHFLWKELASAKEEIDGTRDYLNKFNDLSVRRRIGKAGPEYVEAIDAILDGIELRKQTNKALNRRASLESYLRKMELEDDALITIPPELRSETSLKNFRQMTLDDLRTVKDAVRNIEATAGLKNKLYDGREYRNFHATAIRAAEHIKANLGNPYAEKPGSPQNPSWWDRKKSWLREGAAQKKKIEFVARELDGGVTAGPMHELIFQPFATAEAKRHELTRAITDKLLEPLHALDMKERARFDREVDFLGTPMKIKEAISVALNLGNEGNKRKLLDGYGYRGWTEEFVVHRLGEILSAKDKELIQHFWDTTNSLWPHIKELSERTTGLAPPKVDAQPITIGGTELKGGYYPIIYDRTRNYRAEQNAQSKGDLFENNFMKPGTSKGFTESRTKFAAPLLLSLDVLPAHINEVVHYLTHYEPVRAVDRLLSQGDVRTAITEGLGRETYKQLRPWMQAIAHDGAISNNLTQMDAILRHLRVGAAVTRLGFRVTNSLMQGFNLLSTVKELGGAVEGGKYLTLGISRWLKDMDSFTDPFSDVREHSPEIAGKGESMQRELLGNFDHFTSAFDAFGEMKERLGHFAMSFMSLAWRTCDTISWYAAREKAFDIGHDRPEEYADSVVRMAQMGEGIKDKAALMRSDEGVKMFTNMYSWYSVIYNQLAETQPRTRNNWQKTGELASRYWWMVLAPTVLMSLARGKGPDNRNKPGAWAKYYAGELAVETAKPWPVAGFMADAMLSEHGGGKFGSWISTVTEGVKARGKLMEGGKLSDHEKKALVESTGIVGHLPATAMWNACKYVSAVADGKMKEPVKDLLFRAPGDWK